MHLLTAAAADALRAWTQSRPEAASDHVFVSLARNRPPEPLVPRAVNKLVGAYAERAQLRGGLGAGVNPVVADTQAGPAE